MQKKFTLLIAFILLTLLSITYYHLSKTSNTSNNQSLENEFKNQAQESNQKQQKIKPLKQEELIGKTSRKQDKFISTNKKSFYQNILGKEYYDKEQAKIAFNQFLENHEYNNRNFKSYEEWKAIPKKDRPDLAMEQDFLRTLDPALGYVPYDRRTKAFQQTQEKLANKAAISGVNWTERGPDNIGGRTRAVMFDPNDVNDRKVWAGGVAGGLWFNNDITDANSSWQKVDDFWDNMAITCIAYDPSNTNIFYVGTGEGFFNSDAVRGGGIWKTTDGGTTWSTTPLANTIPASSGEQNGFSYIQKIVVNSSGDVFAACRGTFSNRGGVFKSSNEGSDWDLVLSPRNGVGVATDASTNDRVSDIEIGSNDILYASFGIFSNGKIYQSSTSAGTSWSDITPSGGSPNRIEIALAPSTSGITSSTTIYAVAHGGSGSNDVEWFKKSTDGGGTWSDITIPTEINTGNHFTRGQAWYDLILAVHPTDPDLVIAGGINLSRTTDGGSNWVNATNWALNPSSIFYSHADHHAIVFRPNNSNEVIVGNDGGLSYSTTFGDATQTAGTSDVQFETRIQDYNVTQFYACATKNESESNYFLAGAQDNGSLQFTSVGINSVVEVTGGDGGFCHIDQDTPSKQITSFVRSQFWVSTDDFTSDTQVFFSGSNGSFINPSDYDSETDHLYFGWSTGSYAYWDTDNAPVNPDGNNAISGNTITHIRVSDNTSDRIFAGDSNGNVYIIDDANTGSPTITQIDNLTTPISTVGSVSCIEIGKDDNHLLVTFSNYGVTSVWETLDGGTNWSNKEGDLPDMPIRWALYNPADYREVLLATEAGIYSTDDISIASPVWGPTNTDLANVRCDMLQYRPVDGTVVVATHARGLFTTDVFSTPYTWTGAVSNDWNNAENWIPKTIPTGSDNVFFPESVTNRVIVSNELDFSSMQACNNLTVENGRILNIGGDLTVNGTFNSSGTIIFDGTSQQNLGIATLNNLTINNSSGLQLSGDVDVSGNLTLTSGDIDANNNTIDLGMTGLLSETGGNFTNGTITAQGTINNETKDIGGIGAEITTNVNMGNTTITRRHVTPVDPDFEVGIGRVYDITPTTNTGLNATLVYNFTSAESSTVELATATLFRSTSSGADNTWTDEGGTVVGNTITLTGINAFSSWTGGGDNGALPVTLLNFDAIRKDDTSVKLIWQTVSEKDNMGFDIEVSSDGQSFEKVDFVDGAGDSNTILDYQFLVTNSEDAYYRLKQIDFDGSFSYSPVRFVEGLNTSVFKVFPNPTQDKITLQIPQKQEVVRMQVFDISGKLKFDVEGKEEDLNTVLALKTPQLEKGAYIISVKTASKNYQTKFIKQ